MCERAATAAAVAVVVAIAAAHWRTHIFYYKWFSFGVFIFTIIRIVKWTIAAVDLCYKYKIYGLFNLDKFWPVFLSLQFLCTHSPHTPNETGSMLLLLYMGRVSALKYISNRKAINWI